MPPHTMEDEFSEPLLAHSDDVKESLLFSSSRSSTTNASSNNNNQRAAGLIVSHRRRLGVPLLAMGILIAEAQRILSNGSQIHSPFSSIRVISLPFRHDRREHMRNMSQFLGLQFTFVDALDKKSSEVQQMMHSINSTIAEVGIVEEATVSSRESHRRAILEAEMAGDNITLILEDDVDFETSFVYLSQLVMDALPTDGWDSVYFGHMSWVPDDKANGRPKGLKWHHPALWNSVAPQGGHAYALSKAGRQLLLSILNSSLPHSEESKVKSPVRTDLGQPIDELYASLSVQKVWRSITVIPNIVVQAAGFGTDIQPDVAADAQIDVKRKGLMDSAMRRMRH